MSREYSLTPKRVARVETTYRRIVTKFPVPQSIPVLEKLQALEPVAMRGQPPVVWSHANGFQVSDAWGNQWIDWSSGVLITNAGHGRREIVDAIVEHASSEMLTNYCFPSEIRKRMVETLAGLLPAPLEKVFLLTTGSETVECAIKLCRIHGVLAGGRRKHVIVSFEKAFHGRTLGSQQAGGIPALKEWIVNLDPGFVQVPFPDGFRTEDNSFAGFERALSEHDILPEDVAGVMLETYQGGSAAFAPAAYMQSLRRWCTEHNALLVCDEVQAGFGRTGKLWGFEHYGIVPDLALFGKGISSSLALLSRGGRASGYHGSAFAGQHDFNAHGQSDLLRSCTGIDRSAVEREPDGKRAEDGRHPASAAARVGGPVPPDRTRGWQGTGGRHRVREGGDEGAGRRSCVGRGRALH